VSQVGFPDDLEVGLGVERLGTSSVTYRLGVFRAGEAQVSAVGRFVHVYVDPTTRRPVPLPDEVRTALADIGG
jgi:acyl-CoA thioester hydrolase